ncbi:zinc-ribbon domain-containing protein [Silvibacterium dinghuense]|uniref:Zinc-ribbon domain-containing protein n=1 Tax=Silvibacterium dinghuense TaxID=1560006 RepID=A0A4Q1SIG4_9BACT|nr:zinc-ribbon domain-containing protein [Silvibacterium dinghuense]RXS97394.1 hypothetical protein ESZ00_05690 [Silvibacterium dinghuense]
MELICHRCGTALSASESYCPHCGSPQLRYEPADEAEEVLNANPQMLGRDPGVVLWKPAITTAALVALPVGILSSLLDFGALWVIGGGILAVSLYRRRTGLLPARSTGWRIGGLLGVLAAFVANAVDSLTMVLKRYALHNGAAIDRQYLELGQQMTTQMAHSNPEAAATIPWFLHFWLTPDGTAAMALMGAVGSAIAMLLFAAAGGAIGVRIAAFGSRTARSS